MDALAADHDAAVQMIDTSVVRVHQHGHADPSTNADAATPGHGVLETLAAARV
jgi:hypothetical protein